MLGRGQKRISNIVETALWEFPDLLGKERWRTTKIQSVYFHDEFWRSVPSGG